MLDGVHYLYLEYLTTQDKSTIGYVERQSDDIYAQIYTLYTLYPTNAVKKMYILRHGSFTYPYPNCKWTHCRSSPPVCWQYHSHNSE